jgi:hypothetical protein
MGVVAGAVNESEKGKRRVETVEFRQKNLHPVEFRV